MPTNPEGQWAKMGLTSMATLVPSARLTVVTPKTIPGLTSSIENRSVEEIGKLSGTSMDTV